MDICACDAGRDPAFATFRRGRLYWTWSDSETLPSPPADFPPDYYSPVDRYVLELPQIYRWRNTKVGADPNDLITITHESSLRLGEMHGRIQVDTIKPAEWKGQLKKPVCHMRVWRALTLGEREIFAQRAKKKPEEIGAKIKDAAERYARTGKVTGYAWRAHNLLDAVGIGLYILGRTQK